jgi:hypothetical protein
MAAIIAVAYACGCSLLVDTSGLGDPPAGPAADDAASDIATDGATSLDASASPDADAGNECKATFCDDFDRTPLGATWTSKLVTNGGVLELASPGRSPPNAFRARFSTSTSTDDRFAFLERELGAGSRLSCEFSMFLEVPPQKGGFIDVFRVHTTGPNVSEYLILLGIDGDGDATLREDLFYGDGGCGCPRTQSSPASLGDPRWIRVGIETDFVTASVAFDGATVIAGKYGGFKPTSNISVAVGSLAYRQQESVVLIDDFSCTLLP